MSKSDAISNFQIAELVFTIRFIQGYRYLDRCGEALVRLENTIDEGWIQKEITPGLGRIINYTLGMEADFNPDILTCRQREFISFEIFCDQTCKIFEILRNTFEIKHIFTPVLQVNFQIGFVDIPTAEKYITDLNLCKPYCELLETVGGSQENFTFTVCTREELKWQGILVSQRCRLEARVIQQEHQPHFDQRILQRVEMIGKRLNVAMNKLKELRRQHSSLSKIAAQFNMERSFESEFNSATFNLHDFLSESYNWADKLSMFIKHKSI